MSAYKSLCNDLCNEHCDIDHQMVNNILTENARSELEEFSYHLHQILSNRIDSIGMPIGDGITPQKLFDFHIKLLLKYPHTVK